jgi:tripartite-type tricarboxylate transporter receptor subunit TctC
MNLVRRRFLSLAGLALVSPAAPRIARAQNYPTRSVRVIVPFAPGGATDLVARIILQELSKQIGQQFYVENIAGASGNMGTGQAAKAPPDGYTVLFAFSSHVTNPLVFDKVPYDPFKDFAPVTLIVTSPAALCVNPSLPAKTIKELVALIRANPGKFSFASGGTGTQPHLAGEQFRLSLGLDLVHVPYNGGGPALASAVAGHTPICFTTLSPAVAHIKEGRLRALAVTGRTRSQTVPDIPTMGEAGYPDIDGDTWVGVLVPAGTDSQIVTLLNREIVKLVGVPAVSERLLALGYEPVGNTPGEYAAQMRTEAAKWAKVIRSAGIKLQ